MADIWRKPYSEMKQSGIELHFSMKMDKTINHLAKYYGKDWDKAEKMKILMNL